MINYFNKVLFMQIPRNEKSEAGKVAKSASSNDLAKYLNLK